MPRFSNSSHRNSVPGIERLQHKRRARRGEVVQVWEELEAEPVQLLKIFYTLIEIKLQKTRLRW